MFNENLTVSNFIRFLQELEFGGATGRSREINFWLCNKDGKAIKKLELFSYGAGDGLITELTLFLKESNSKST